MSINLTLHDLRLNGQAPRPAGYDVLKVGAADDLYQTFKRIAALADAGGGVRRLNVMCHGYGTPNANEESQSRADQQHWRGAGGLQLCRQGLRAETVGFARELGGRVGAIVIYACMAADTQRGAEGTRWDGRLLCAEFAAHSGATVYAADRAQVYNWRQVGAAQGVIDFGRWEGTMYAFDPDGAPPAVVSAGHLPAA